MPVDFVSRNSLLLGVAESPAGTEGAPAAASNAIRMDAPVFSASFDKIDTNYAQAGISQAAPIVGGGMVGMAFNSFLSGAAAAGSAPDYGIGLRGCSMQETLTAADITNTAQAGAAGSITLAVSGSSATNDAYKGMVIETTGGTGGSPSQRRVISGYNGSTKIASIYPNWTVTPDATTVYAIRKNARYTPISVAQELLTLWAYQRNLASGGNAKLRRLKSGAGNVTIGIKPRSLATIGFKFQGQLPANPADVSDPGAGTLTGADPRPYLNAQTYLGGVATKFNDFSLDMGNTIKAFDDPSALYGYDTFLIPMRVPTGKIVPPLSLTASRDSFADWLASASKPLWMCWGAVGSGVSLYMPALRYTGNEPGDVDGFQTEGIPFQATGSDSEVLLSIF